MSDMEKRVLLAGLVLGLFAFGLSGCLGSNQTAQIVLPHSGESVTLQQTNSSEDRYSSSSEYAINQTNRSVYFNTWGGKYGFGKILKYSDSEREYETYTGGYWDGPVSRQVIYNCSRGNCDNLENWPEVQDLLKTPQSCEPFHLLLCFSNRTCQYIHTDYSIIFTTKLADYNQTLQAYALENNLSLSFPIDGDLNSGNAGTESDRCIKPPFLVSHRCRFPYYVEVDQERTVYFMRVSRQTSPAIEKCSDESNG